MRDMRIVAGPGEAVIHFVAASPPEESEQDGLFAYDARQRYGFQGYQLGVWRKHGCCHLAGRKLSIIPIRARTNQIEDLLPFVDVSLDALKTIMPGQIVPVG